MMQTSYNSKQLEMYLNSSHMMKMSPTSNIVYMQADLFWGTINEAFKLGAQWVLYNWWILHDIESNSSDLELLVEGVLSLASNMEALYSKIDDLDKKYDDKIGKIEAKINEIDKRVVAIEERCTQLKEDLQEIKDKLAWKTDWWFKYILGPIISGVVVGLIMLFANNLFK